MLTPIRGVVGVKVACSELQQHGGTARRPLADGREWQTDGLGGKADRFAPGRECQGQGGTQVGQGASRTPVGQMGMGDGMDKRHTMLKAWDT